MPALPPLRLGCKLWLLLPDQHGLGEGLADLLRRVEREGTLRAAAASAGMSYRHAWALVHEAEAHLGLRLVESRPGGRRGGRSELSPAGLALVELLERLHADVLAFAEQHFEELVAELRDSDGEEAP